jgi:hypothetical protein
MCSSSRLGYLLLHEGSQQAYDMLPCTKASPSHFPASWFAARHFPANKLNCKVISCKMVRCKLVCRTSGFLQAGLLKQWFPASCFLFLQVA